MRANTTHRCFPHRISPRTVSTILDQGNRTFIGSVVFIDIVGYSKTSVTDQLVLKDRFTALLADSLKDIAMEQRIILDTGDGAAVSFLGDPEDALFVSMHMRDFLQRTYAGLTLPADSAQEDIDIGPQGDLSLRIGINLGPVKLLRDINGQPNIVGDGINVAQRIQSFARPGQIVVSRSYFDVVSVISDEYAKLFKYEGSRTDKHVREHEIYVVGESVAAFDQARAGLADRAASTNPKSMPPNHVAVSTGSHAVAVGHENAGNDTTHTGSTGDAVPFLADRKKLTIAGGVLSALVLVLVVAAVLKKPSEPAKVVPPLASKPITTAAATTPPVPSAANDTPAPADTKKTEPPPPPAAAVADEASKALALKPAVVKDAPVLPAEPAKAVAKAPEPGTLSLRIDPWGEVLVNGRSIGVSPPLKQHKLPPGKYKIEVKNGALTPLITTIEIKSKEEFSVKHKFQ